MHNVSLLVNMYESRIHEEKRLDDIKSKRRSIGKRKEHLMGLIDMISRVEQPVYYEPTSAPDSHKVIENNSLQSYLLQLEKLFSVIRKDLSSDEFDSLHPYDIVLPLLLKPTLDMESIKRA